MYYLLSLIKIDYVSTWTSNNIFISICMSSSNTNNNKQKNKRNNKKGRYMSKCDGANKDIFSPLPTDNCEDITVDDIELICNEMAGNSKLSEIIKKLEKLNNDKKADKKAEYRIKEYNKCVDIIMKRYRLGVAFNDTVVNMINSEVYDLYTKYIVGFVDALPRQMIEIMCHKIGDDTDELCSKITGCNKLRYILLNSVSLTNELASPIIVKIVINIMNMIKDANKNIDICFGSYKITDVVYIPDGTSKNINYHISMEDSETGDDVFIDFWLQSAEIENNCVNISTLCINNNGLVVRVKDFNTINIFETCVGQSVLDMKMYSKMPVYGGFFQVINDMFNNRGVVLHKKILEQHIQKLDTHTLTRSEKVKIMLNIMSFYNEHIHKLIPKYINKTNMTGLPAYYVETEEACLYTAIDPPYIKLKLECGHDMSIQSIYGLLVEGGNDDTESISCQLCGEKFEFKLIEQSDSDKELWKNENVLEYPHVYTYDELDENICTNRMVVKNCVSNRESIDFINNMMLQYHKECNFNEQPESESDGLSDDDSELDAWYDDTGV